MFSTLATALPRIETKEVRPLGILGPARSPRLPDLPTLVEQGYGKYEHFKIWGSIVGPPALPDRIVLKLTTTIESALADEDVRRSLDRVGLIPSYEDQGTLKTRIADQYETFTEFLKKNGITNF
jgi:tripartite-type tricarboxylate transporter receptor subunit TctC